MAVAVVPLREAVTVALPLAMTVPEVAVKEAVVEEAATVTDAGTFSTELLEDNDTVSPPEGAAPDSVTVHEVLLLEARLEAVHVNEDRLTGATSEIGRDNEVPLRDAVMVAVELEVTVPAVAVKDAVVAEAATPTEDGTLKLALLEDNVTTVPPVGAGSDSVTVHEVVAWEVRLEALHCNESRQTGATSDKVVLAVVLLSEAVMVPL